MSLYSSQQEYTSSDPKLLPRLSYPLHLISTLVASGPSSPPLPSPRLKGIPTLRHFCANCATATPCSFRFPLTQTFVTTLPLVALRFLRHCATLADGGAFVLVADKGPFFPDEVALDREPVPWFSRGFRLPVAFDLLRRFAQSTGGFAVTEDTHEDYRVCFFGIGAKAALAQRSRLCFRQTAFRSLELGVSLQEAFLESPHLSAMALLALLRLAQNDQEMVLALREALPRVLEANMCVEDVRHQLTQVGKRGN